MTSFAIVATVIVVRTILVLLEATDRIWIGSFIYGLTTPVTDALGVFPGATRVVVVNLTIMDVTLLATIPLFLLGVVATGGRREFR